ncbi:unnamed protein product [Closterium sp. NIES-53]
MLKFLLAIRGPISLSLLRFGCVVDMTGLDGEAGIVIAWWNQLEWPTGEELVAVCEGQPQQLWDTTPLQQLRFEAEDHMVARQEMKNIHYMANLRANHRSCAMGLVRHRDCDSLHA